MSGLKRIPARHLKKGMFLVEYGDGSYQSPRVEPRRYVEEDTDIESIVNEAYSVIIDTRKGLDTTAGADAEAEECLFHPDPDEATYPVPEVAFGDELFKARKVYNRALDFTSQFLAKVRDKQPLDPSEAEPVAEDISDTAGRSHRAAASLAVVRSHGWLTNHSVNTAFLAAAFARWRSLPGAEVKQLILAGLFHDIGKVHLPDSIMNKPGKLTTTEFEIVKRHPLDGCTILKDAGGLSNTVLRAVLEHHENEDGSGYPRGITSPEISPLAKHLSVCDIYDALISYRTYRRAMTPLEALRCLYHDRGNRHCPECLDSFIRFIGIYPVGSFVRLSDGRHGVVTDFVEKKSTRPTVKVVYDRKLRSILPQTVDLSEARGELKVEECINPRDLKIDIELFLP